MPSLSPAIIQWGISSYSGWGVNGLNIVLNWVREEMYAPVCSLPLRGEEISVSPMELSMLADFIRNSNAFCEQLAPHSGQEISVSVPVLRGLGNNLAGSRSVGQNTVIGRPTIGVCYLEDTAFDAEVPERAKLYDGIVAGSTFVKQRLAAAGIPSRVVLQGVDPTHFHPAPRSGWFNGRFTVFSGGKPEFRKGQDLVLAAFRAFAERHSDAILLTAWHSPWPQSAKTLDANPMLSPTVFKEDGRFDVIGWAVANGLRADQVFDLGHVPNADMARILREADVGLFPNRGEGGTNLVAMECMACGVPVILSANTGHLDLIGRDNCYVLSRQAAIDTRYGAEGWGESDVEEIVEKLEAAYTDRKRAAEIASAGAAAMSLLTWQNYARGVAALVKDCGG